MEVPVSEELLARAIGWEVLNFIKHEGVLDALASEMDGDAMRILEQVRCLLNDESLDDPECFRRIDAIVDTFYANGIHTSRHDWS